MCITLAQCVLVPGKAEVVPERTGMVREQRNRPKRSLTRRGYAHHIREIGNELVQL